MSISRGLFISFLVSTLCFCSCNTKKNSSNQPIINWQFKNDTSQTWLSASVPGSVQTDLLSNHQIPDPFFGDNEQKLQWIGESDWTYKSTFKASDMLNNDHVELVFDGLDTYADVFLNDSLILEADNMFRRWTVEVKDLLNKGENELLIKFTAPEKIEQEKAAELSYQLPDSRGFTRKAPYQYGWDWGPKFVTQGIWKPVYLSGWNDVRINDIHVYTKSISDSVATMEISADIESTQNQTAEITLTTNNRSYSGKIVIKKGSNLFTKEIFIADPKLWWPNGMGDHPLYDLTFLIKAGSSEDSRTVKFGIRQIELVREKDSIGESFYFKINGIPFFAKGANYIPQDNFPARVTDEKYRQTIQNAVDANMNMLRVWGGGIYEKDIFYDLCDEKGILVWQDFMFACNMYPGDPAFLENVKQEAEYQVKRLRNHPSMALWCGNNEVSEGWFNWGWQQSLGYSKADSTELWHNYQKIFEEILPETVQKYNSEIAYHPSSPKIGWGHVEALREGDMHYWGVWWGEEPFEIYEEKVGRFMSEYGFQGFPDLQTLDSCLAPEDRTLDSPALLNHQKHPRGMELIQSYMEREFPVPADFEDYIYVSQLVQAYGIRKAIEAHRRAMPRCMGTLYWQLNDCWPVISWSSVDYYNRWKALHYFVRDAYENLSTTFTRKNDSLHIYITSDLKGIFPAVLDVELIDFNGRKIWNDTLKVSIKDNVSLYYYSINLSNLVQTLAPDTLIIVAKLRTETGIVWNSNHWFFVSPKDLFLKKPSLTHKTYQSEYGRYIHIKTDVLAKNICLKINKDGYFTNNYFDLLPNDSIIIEFKCDDDKLMEVKPIENFDEKLSIKTLFDVMNK